MQETLGENSATRTIAAIERGTVIDHIQAGQAIQLMKMLKLEDHSQMVTLGINLPSTSQGLKDVIKVADRELTREETSKIAILSPNATINIIVNYRVQDKYQVTLPEFIEGFIACPNARCITNHEQMASQFHVQPYRGKILLTCKYCEKSFGSHILKN